MGRDYLRQAEVEEGCSYSKPNMVDLMECQLVEHKDINVKVPGKLSFKDDKLVAINYIGVEGLQNLQHPGAGLISVILVGEQRRSRLRALQMKHDLSFYRLTWERFLDLCFNSNYNLSLLFAKGHSWWSVRLLYSWNFDGGRPAVSVGATIISDACTEPIYNEGSFAFTYLLLHLCLLSIIINQNAFEALLFISRLNRYKSQENSYNYNK